MGLNGHDIRSDLVVEFRLRLQRLFGAVDIDKQIVTALLQQDLQLVKGDCDRFFIHSEETTDIHDDFVDRAVVTDDSASISPTFSSFAP